MKPADPEIGFVEDVENLRIGDNPRSAVVAVIHVEVSSGRVRWYSGTSIPARNPLPGLDPVDLNPVGNRGGQPPGPASAKRRWQPQSSPKANCRLFP